MENRRELRKRKKIVIKVGSSTITHEKTGQINIEKIEKMARRIADLKGMGKDVILVSSGAIAAGRQALGNGEKPKTLSQKQAFSAVGQARLMMIYQKIFSEYNITTAQVLMTKSTMIEDDEEFMKMGKGTNSNVGTGGMQTKLIAAKIATAAGADMVIANGKNMDIISEVMKGRAVGTLFMAHKSKVFDLVKVIEEEM